MLVLGLATWWLFARTVEPGILTKFGLTPGGSTVKVPDLVFPTQTVLYVLAALQILLGIIQLARIGGFRERTNLVLFLAATMFIVAFLTWGAGGKSLNVGGLMKTTLVKAVPLTLGAMSGILCERAGVVNIAIEGMMLAGAFAGAFFGSVSGNLWMGVAAGVGIGVLLGVLHGVLEHQL